MKFSDCIKAEFSAPKTDNRPHGDYIVQIFATDGTVNGFGTCNLDFAYEAISGYRENLGIYSHAKIMQCTTKGLVCIDEVDCDMRFVVAFDLVTGKLDGKWILTSAIKSKAAPAINRYIESLPHPVLPMVFSGDKDEDMGTIEVNAYKRFAEAMMYVLML